MVMFLNMPVSVKDADCQQGEIKATHPNSGFCAFLVIQILMRLSNVVPVVPVFRLAMNIFVARNPGQILITVQ